LSSIRKPSGIDAPEPWNFNDTIVWKGIICKFICEKKKRTFYLSELLSYDKIPVMAGAYNQNDIKNAIHDDEGDFRKLIDHCLNWLKVNTLIEVQENTSSVLYNTTSRLESLCPEIIKYQLPVLDPVIEAEKEILNRNTFPAIHSLLLKLEKTRDLDIYEGSKIVDENTLYLINQLGVIYISLSGKISISPVGQMVVTLLDQHFGHR
jgi:hypothetical protein